MPTLLLLQARSHDGPHAHTSTGAGFDVQQRLLLCLAVVVAAVLSAFGAARVIEYVTRKRVGEDNSEQTKLAGADNARLRPRPRHHRSYSTKPALDPRRSSSFFSYSLSRPATMCFKPITPFYGAVTYVRTSPSLHHITAQRLYASRHPHRSKTSANSGMRLGDEYRGRPRAPSPLRHVLFPLASEAEAQTEVDVTDQASEMKNKSKALQQQHRDNPKDAKKTRKGVTSVKKALNKLGLAPLREHNRLETSTARLAHPASKIQNKTRLAPATVDVGGLGKENLRTAVLV
ncbi:hypothetical protein C8F01DRAFT_1369692 [Mycena amicta]|nr:hypothetical protein C8F01DRAFT_1369692 [Mycena amicta]